jgi:acyl-[acyl-carrier-protein]-phospholipid O-acyltransferase / long-chain-fatty-acid--[acyl-carrier-protein] ligase
MVKQVYLYIALSIKSLVTFFMRLLCIFLSKALYNVSAKASENLPKQGAALLVANHISIMDGLFLHSSLKRPIHFFMEEAHYKKRWIYPFFRYLHVVTSCNEARDLLDKGQLVCLFAEGQISYTGKILPFKKEIESITQKQNCPIIPVYLENVWGNVTSHKKGATLKKFSLKLRSNFSIFFGQPLSSKTSFFNMQRAVQELEYQALETKKRTQPPIHHLFIRNVRKNPFKHVLMDEERQLNGAKTLAGAIALAKHLEPKWASEKSVAIVLPTTIAGTIINLAIAFSGRSAINLNFTAGREAMESAIKQAGLKSLITSRLFLAKSKCELPSGIEIIYAEDLVKKISNKDRLKALFIGLFTPLSYLEKYCGCSDQITTSTCLSIIFTSGSTGEPKGVVLTHLNISSNVNAISNIVPCFGKDKTLLASLPYFHAFGYMLMWLGLNHKFGLVIHPNPLDAKVIGKLIEKHKVKLVMTTPTFLRGYIRQIPAHELTSLDCVITGAEKLSSSTAKAFHEKFGIRPMEGYGATECSPVIAASTLDVKARGICQIGSLEGAVGQALPGVLIKIVDPETFLEVSVGMEGLILVKGQNVMQEYLNREDLTKEVMVDGFYITGDIGAIDESGFIKITDRLRRISKIGGEMVPHGRIEEALHEAAESEEQVFAVTAIPDAKKGERLAVLYTLERTKLGEVLKNLSEKGLSNLYIPRLDHFIQVERLPFLGSGKIDLQMIKLIALEQTEQIA